MHTQQLLWRTEKYRVMYHSQTHYNQIRQLMRDGCTLETLQKTIDEATALTPTDGSRRNALQHMWGYFKKCATVDEKAHYLALLEAADWQAVRLWLALLAMRYNIRYLQQSTILHQD
ncbi:YbgA family protein [Kurthia huakuii]|uniref:YbgA family protein n=1 Tax=Kurthia huakuii TaxID=1421019 RepID=UPI0004BC8948|nr:YbgA family protein [Kurthia huakuii]MBM7698709.1 uncharacterized protein YbgA (DUF1722 family) [Kurthia huakuii]